MSGTRGPGAFDLALAAGLAALVLLASQLAYASASDRHDAGRFVGALADPLHVEIGAIYGSFAREVADGGGLFVHNHQTSEPHAAAQARPWEWLLGRLTRAVDPADPAAFVFHADRVAAVVLFALLLAWLAAELLATRLARAAALVGALTFTNLYWVVELAGRPAALRTWLDAGHADLSGMGFGYAAALLGVPHLVLELAFLCGTVAAVLALVRQDRAERADGRARGRARLALAAVGGLAFLGLASARPYTAPVAAVVVAALLAHRTLGLRPPGRPLGPALVGSLGLGLVVALPALPLLLHQRALVQGGSIFGGLDVVHLSPPLLEQALFLGPALLVVALGVRTLARAAGRDGLGPTAAPRALLVWLVAGGLLANGAPLVPWEVEALGPLALVVLLLALVVLEAWDGAGRRLLARTVGALLLVSGVVGTGLRWAELSDGLDRTEPHLWLSAGSARLVDHLEGTRAGLAGDHPAPVVAIEDRDLAPLLPWLAGVRVYLGHRDHTHGWPRKAGELADLLAEGRRLGFLYVQGATHLATVAPAVGAWDPTRAPGVADFLERELDDAWRLDRILAPAGNAPVPFVPGAEAGPRARPTWTGEAGPGEPGPEGVRGGD